jgi:hypothetical protein
MSQNDEEDMNFMLKNQSNFAPEDKFCFSASLSKLSDFPSHPTLKPAYCNY